MSEITVNPAPAPELLIGMQGPARARPEAPAPGAGAPAGRAAPNPFAALLAGVLGTTAPGPAADAALAITAPATDTTEPASPATDPALLIGLPGTATITATPLADPADGKALPAGGKDLPLPAPPAVDPAASLAPAAPKPAPVPAETPRVFLADLALSRPVDPGLTAAATPAADPAAAEPPITAPRSAPAVLAEGLADVAGRRRGPPTPASSAPGLATPPAAAPTITPAPLPPGGTDRLALRLAGLDAGNVTSAAMPATDALASQLAAFAATPDGATTSPATGTSPSITTATDPTGLAAGGRAAGTLLLQPLAVTGDPGAFASGLADRLVTLGGAGTHSARLKLHPEHLGELDIEITMDDGKAQVWFGAASSQARDAIQDSLPRLKELFADQGIQLTRTQVDTGGGAPANPGFGQDRRMPSGAGAWRDPPAWVADRGAATLAAALPRAPVPSRLLDVWA